MWLCWARSISATGRVLLQNINELLCLADVALQDVAGVVCSVVVCCGVNFSAVIVMDCIVLS